MLGRLRDLDARARRDGLDSLDPSTDSLIPIGMEIDASGRVTKNSLGVFNLAWQAAEHPEWPDRIAAEVEEICRGIKQAHKVRLRFLIWAGMGGSAEDKAMYNAVGLLKRGPRVYILDSTDPAKLKSILADMERRTGLPLFTILKSTLVVGMAMGMTSYEPVVNLEKLAVLYAKYKIDSRPNFVYMTLSGSLLDQFASERGFRRIELQPDGANSTAGRHSGPLTRGSLYPLALARVDLKEWFNGAQLSPGQVKTAFHLAAFLHAQGLCGRDKLTLLLPKEWAGAVLWTKQNFEESLGKSEALGIKVVIPNTIKLANYRAPKDAHQDRVFLAVQIKGAPPPHAQKVAMLRRAGYPVALLTFPRRPRLSTYMQFMHYTVFGLAYQRGMNFVTQPGVELYKTITNEIFRDAEHAGGAMQTAAWHALMGSECQSSWRGALTLHYGRGGAEFDTAGMDAPQIYATLLMRLAAERKIEYGELTFFGDTRYSPQGAAMSKTLHRAAEEIFCGRLKMHADVYEGPAMNHSYHEMIIGHGRAISTVLLSLKQEQLPAAGYRSDYHVAQFLATQLALNRKRRAVVAITLANLEEKSLAAAGEFFHRTALALKAAKFRS